MLRGKLHLVSCYFTATTSNKGSGNLTCEPGAVLLVETRAGEPAGQGQISEHSNEAHDNIVVSGGLVSK